MTPRTKKLMLLYLSALVGYAALGAYNQGLFRRQLNLMETKQAKLDAIVRLRSDAADIIGALAVRNWAHEHGMIAAPEGSTPIGMYAVAPPEFVLPQSGLEIRTIWQ